MTIEFLLEDTTDKPGNIWPFKYTDLKFNPSKSNILVVIPPLLII